jgi:PAS domain S-box-containing protein
MQEIALRERTECYHALFNCSVVGVYVHDLNGQFLDANDTALSWFGYTREQIGTLNISDLLDELQMQTALGAIAEVLQIGYNPVPRQYRLTCYNGQMMWLEIEASRCCVKTASPTRSMAPPATSPNANVQKNTCAPYCKKKRNNLTEHLNCNRIVQELNE